MHRKPGKLPIVVAAMLLIHCGIIIVLWVFTTTQSAGESFNLRPDLQFMVSPQGIGIYRISPIPAAIAQREHPEYTGPVFRADDVIVVPYYLAALATAAFPVGLILLHLRRFTVERSRLRSGLCIGCGYNIAFTPHRCPECGLIPAESEASSAVA